MEEGVVRFSLIGKNAVPFRPNFLLCDRSFTKRPSESRSFDFTFYMIVSIGETC